MTAPEFTKRSYKLPMLKEIEEYVASVVEVNIPFNNPITGFCVRSSKSSFRLHRLTARRLSRTKLAFTPRVGTEQPSSFLFSPELTFHSYSSEPRYLRGKSCLSLGTDGGVANR
ncbi:MAG: homocitrate synthase [Mucilaginibacter sp.]|nr:homocitrate synthase [Mucilaginibacter sp.]